MNYTTLFPNLLQRLPKIDFKDVCYNYQKSNNYNKTTKIYLPAGKKLLLWFLKYKKQTYSILIEVNERENKMNKCSFQYLSFKPELTNGCGTIFWCTKINNELSLNKIIYYMGNKYKKQLILDNINDIKYLLENYINNIKHSTLLQLKIPIISNFQNYIYEASCLNYNVYQILTSNNYTINMNSYLANFKVVVVNHLKDIYELHCYNHDNELIKYNGAFINDIKTSQFLKNIFNIKHNHYKEIELSDDEDSVQTNETKEMIISVSLNVTLP